MNSRILFIFICIFIAGCVSVEVCDEEYVSELVARFKTEKDGEPADTTVNALTLYGIREGLSDSLLYDSASVSGFTVPLDPQHDFSSFVMQIDTLRDTLHVYYAHEIYLVSYACGFASLFTLDHLETVSGLILKDTIISTMIDAAYENNEEHIWLYL
jgi:hypothetical protein